MQASILELYDPDRSQVVTRFGTRISTWDAFVQDLQAEIDAQRASQGAGLRILTGLVTSPTLASQLKAILAEFPQARWHQYEPAGSDNSRAGARLAFDQDVETVYNLANAQVILSLDANFLGEGPGQIRYARDFSDQRRFGRAARLRAVSMWSKAPPPLPGPRPTTVCRCGPARWNYSPGP